MTHGKFKDRFTLNTNLLSQINQRNLQLLYPLTLGII